MSEKEECGKCKFWEVRTDYAGNRGGGYCVRFPPIFREDGAMNDGWPNVHQQSWCGEFKSPLIPKPKIERDNDRR